MSPRSSLQLQLNYLGNYVPTAWTYETGCGICDDDVLFFNEVPAPLSVEDIMRRKRFPVSVWTLRVCLCVQDEQMPLVYVAVFIEHATPFMEEFLERLSTLNYPKTRIRLFIHNNVRCTLAQSSSFTALTGTSKGGERFTIKKSELSLQQQSVEFTKRF